jgi:hypothetical protein
MRANVENSRPMLSRVTVLVFFILTLSNVGGLCIGWNHSRDVRAWWPVGAVVFSIIALAYAAVFSAAMRVARVLGMRFAILYNVVRALVLLLHAALFYTIKVDWFAVNTGLAQLTEFQRIVHSDATVYAIYGTFLVGAWIIAGVKRLRSGG